MAMNIIDVRLGERNYRAIFEDDGAVGKVYSEVVRGRAPLLRRSFRIIWADGAQSPLVRSVVEQAIVIRNKSLALLSQADAESRAYQS